MRIRTRLSLAFFLISVVPIGLVTAYSYYSSPAALRRAVEGQADQMAAEMGDRMAWVMTDLGDRVERLWRMRVDSASAAPQGPAAGPDEKAVEELRTVATAMLAEAAPLVRRLEFESSQTGTAATSAQAEPPPPPEPGFGRRGPDFRRGPGFAPEPGQRGARASVGQPGPPGGSAAPGVPVPRMLSKGLRQIGYQVRSKTHIVPIIIGNEKTAMNYGEFLFKRGIYVPPIRYPTVPKNKARLRISVTAWLSEKDINIALSIFEQASKKFKI